MAWRGTNDRAPEGVDADTLRRAVALVNLARDPALPGLVMGVALALAGGVTAFVSGFAAARVPAVVLQTPYLVSGGLGGLALVAVGVLLVAIQMERRSAVDATAELKQVGDDLTAVAEAAIARRQR